VDRAVIAVEKALDHYGAPVYVRKEIVHNKHVVTGLEKRGAIFVDEVDEVPEGSTLVFSAHGVSPAVVKASEARGLNTIDATCQLVTKVHREVQRFDAEEYDILLIGHEGHEEVEGTAGEAVIDAGARSSAVLTSLKRVQKKNKCVLNKTNELKEKLKCVQNSQTHANNCKRKQF
jgi:(E)-4-hydroxy-3-methyl-but-2-enyl pyrophosphate reductase